MRALHSRAVRATAGALNFKDVMLAYGKLSREALAHEGGAPSIGFEFSGLVRLQSLLGDLMCRRGSADGMKWLTCCPPCCTVCMQEGI